MVARLTAGRRPRVSLPAGWLTGVVKLVFVISVGGGRVGQMRTYVMAPSR